MALVTTLMAGPLLKLLDPKNEYGTAVEDEFAAAKVAAEREHPDLAVPDHSILVAPQTDAALPQLVALAKPLASSGPQARADPRAPGAAPAHRRRPRGAADREPAAQQRLQRGQRRARAAGAGGVATRAVALTSRTPGADLAHFAEREPVDLVLVEGRRRLVGEGVPLGEVSTLLGSAPCDVAVLVADEDAELQLGPATPILVPFGGAEHDWSALELGSWLSASTGAPLKLLGAAGRSDEGGRSRACSPTRACGPAGDGVAAEPLVVHGGREGIISAASGAGLLVIGLSERWRREGLGPTRSEIAKAAPAPVLFVRRGTRAGLFAQRDNVTQFNWSRAGQPSVR